MERFSYSRTGSDPVESQGYEIVERKGLGHPDTICDSIAEKVSGALQSEYRDRFGAVLHHNTDEVQLVAGRSNPMFGGGELEKKIFLLLTGRATREFRGEEIPVNGIAVEAAREFIDSEFKALSPEHFEIEARIGETSSDLKHVFEGERRSNDTSFGAAHFPLSRTEKTVKEVEEAVRGIYEVGEDVKVMAKRQDDDLSLVIAAAVIDSRVEGLDDYRGTVQKIEEVGRGKASHRFQSVSVEVNAADDPADGSVYLTVTGTSAENGDDGSVGRGNRYNGLITPERSMSLEAWSGKNPVTHPGKINQIRAQEIAEKIHAETGEFASVEVVNDIGSSKERPEVYVESSAEREAAREAVEDYFEADK